MGTLRLVTDRSSASARAGVLSTVTLALGGIAVASIAVRVALQAMRPSDECGTAFTIAFGWLIWTAIVSAALALVLGVAGLAAKGNGRTRTLVGMGLAVATGILLLIPGVATIVCGEATA